MASVKGLKLNLKLASSPSKTGPPTSALISSLGSRLAESSDVHKGFGLRVRRFEGPAGRGKDEGSSRSRGGVLDGAGARSPGGLPRPGTAMAPLSLAPAKENFHMESLPWVISGAQKSPVGGEHLHGYLAAVTLRGGNHNWEKIGRIGGAAEYEVSPAL